MCLEFWVLIQISSILGPSSPGKLNPNGWAGPKLDGINNSGLKCYWACVFFFLFLGKPWIGAFIFIHILFFFIHG